MRARPDDNVKEDPMRNLFDFYPTCTCGGRGDLGCQLCRPGRLLPVEPLPPAPWEPVTALELPRPRAVEAMMPAAPAEAAAEAEAAGAAPVEVPRPPRRRLRLALCGAAAAAVLVVGLWAALPSIASAPDVLDLGAGELRCEGPADRHLPEAEAQPQTAYSCRWGGRFTCTAARCAIYSWERDPARRRWRYVGPGDVVQIAPGMDHFIERGE